MPRNLAKGKETMATHLIQEGGSPNSLVRTPLTRRSYSLIPKSKALFDLLTVAPDYLVHSFMPGLSSMHDRQCLTFSFDSN